MLAFNYLPMIEVGRRRRRILSGDLGQPMRAEEVERRRRERRRTRAGLKEEDEDMKQVMLAGEVVSQLNCF